MKSFRTKVVTAVAVAAMALSCMGCHNTKVAEGKSAASGIVEQIHEASEKVGKKVSVKLTDIPVDEVSASDGYATLVKEKDYGTEEEPQFYRFTALADQEGKLVFPYKCSRMCKYSVTDDVISFSQEYPSGTREYTYDGEVEYCRYYDMDKNELFDSKLKTAAYCEAGMISNSNAIYDKNGNLIYEIPSDLLDTSVWLKGSSSFPKLNGYPKIKCNFEYNMIKLDYPGEENLIPFESAITMKDKLELPDLSGTKWEAEKDYMGYFLENSVKDGKISGYIDTTGKIVIPQSFAKCGPFHEGLAWVMASDGIKKPEVISSEGEVIRDMFSPERLLGLFDNTECKSGFIDKTGKLVIPCEYDNVYPFYNGVAPVEKDEKCGYIDKSNKILIPIEYEAAFGGENGFYNVMKDGKFGIVDGENREVVPFVFDDMSAPSEGIVYGIYDGKLVIVNLNQDSTSDWDRSADKTGYLPQKLAIKTSSKTVKAAKLKKKAQSFKIASESVTKVAFKKKSGDKRITISSNGKVRLQKGLPKKTYKIKVKATAKDDGLYKSVSKTKTIKIIIK